MKKKKYIILFAAISSFILMIFLYRIFLGGMISGNFSYDKLRGLNEDFKVIETIDKYGNKNESRCYRTIEVVDDGRDVEIWKKVIEPESRIFPKEDIDGSIVEVEFIKEIHIDEDGYEHELWKIAQDPEMVTLIYEGFIEKVTEKELIFRVGAQSRILSHQDKSYKPFKVGPYEKVFNLDEYDLQSDYPDFIMIEGRELKDTSVISEVLKEEGLFGEYLYIQDSTVRFFENGPTFKSLSIRDFIFKDAQK
jgi:hypothetical protein